MITQQEIKANFNQLSLAGQNNLLFELLLEQELQGKVLQEASKEVK